MAEKTTVMLIKADLQCPCCYKKVKKILCKFPQIRDQVYNEKANTVTITVVCCSPEKIRDKIRCKGGKVIRSIEIVEPPKPKPPQKPKEPTKPQEPEKPKVPEKPKEPEKPKQPEKPKEPEKPKQPEKPKEPEKPKQPEKPKEPPKKPEQPPKAPEQPPTPTPPPPKMPEPVPCWCPPAYPTGYCCEQCFEGYPGGPCYHGYGRPITPPPPLPSYCTCGCGGYGHRRGCTCGCGGYGYGRGCYVTRCDYYCNDENPQACSIM